MRTLHITTPDKSYPIYINDSFSALEAAFENISASKVCIVTDTNVEKIYLENIKTILSKKYNVCSFVFEAGENSKNLDVIRELLETLCDERLDRKSLIVALGGGVVGDMAGFAASVYMRGIPFVQIPTTLLAQVDSSVGGKTGVDFKGNKNMIGAFYQPEFVYINSSTLKTLPYRQVAAGLAEALKYGYIIKKELVNYFKENIDKIIALDKSCIEHIIFESCDAKAFVVGEDEKENGLRAILNFGHTFGHSVETLNEFKLLHGECVAIGMVAAVYYSLKKGNVQKEDLDLLKELLTKMKLPILCDNSSEDIIEQMQYDKKTASGKITVISLESIGKAAIEKNAPIAAIKEATDYITK